MTVSYTAADAGDEPLRDAAGNKAADLSRQAVTHRDTTAPVLLRAEVRGSELELVYDEALRTGALGTLSFANTKVDGVVRNVTGARVRAATPNSVFLTLASPVTEGQAVLVNYNRTRLGPSLRIRDLAGNEAASLVDQPVKSDHTPPSLSTAAVEGTSLGADLRRGACGFGAAGRSVRGDGGGEQPDDRQRRAERDGGDADAGLGGGQDRHGDGELHGGGRGRRADPGRGGQQGGGPEPPGGDGRRHDGAGAPARGGTRQRVGAGLRRGAEDRGLGHALLREHQGGRGRPERHGCQGPRGHAQLRLPHAGLAGDRGPGRAGELQQDEAGSFFTDPGPGRQRGGVPGRPTGEERSHAAVAVDGGGGGDVAGADLRRGACGFGAAGRSVRGDGGGEQPGRGTASS